MKDRKIIPVKDKHIVRDPIGNVIVLWTIREHAELTFSQLYELIYGYKFWRPSEFGFLISAIENLVECGLIDISNFATIKELRPNFSAPPFMTMPDERGTSIILRISQKVNAIQRLFQISITEFAKRTSPPVFTDPVFGQPRSSRREAWPDVFVLMPFSPQLKPVYDDHIVSVMNKLGISCERGDDFFSAQSIIDEIWTAIYQSELCIADCTGRNPNVFYEIGVAHTLGRPVILISQSLDDIPFDIRHRRIIIYEYTPRGMKEFEENLAKTLKHELSKDDTEFL